MQIQNPASPIQTSPALNTAQAAPVNAAVEKKTEAGKDSLDALSLSGAGQRFVAGAINGTKGAAIPAAVAMTASLIASDPNYAGLAILAGPAVGLIGAGAAGLVIGGTANALGAGKTASTLSGAAAGAATGWALNNLGSPKTRLLTAGMGAAVGAAAGFTASGAKLENNELNRGIGAVVGLVAASGVAIALSGGKDVNAWGMLLSVAGGVGGYQAVKQLGE
jgi:hypothetical protein